MPTNAEKITDAMVQAVKKWLGPEGISFFRALQEHHGRVDPVLMIYGQEDAKLSNETIKKMADPNRKVPKDKKPLPHPVYFREGMQVRNVLRDTNLCEGWTHEDYEALWDEVVRRAIA